MKQNSESITTLRKYIAIGYAVIALLIGGVALIYLFEWQELELIEAESTKAFFDILNKTKKMRLITVSFVDWISCSTFTADLNNSRRV